MTLPSLPRHCVRCGCSFKARRWTAIYCGSACRQADYIQRAKVERKKLVKPSRDVMGDIVTCACCDAKVWATHNGKHAIYCSNKCRQKAYRERVKRGIDAWGAKRI